jgi:hypothetical protein
MSTAQNAFDRARVYLNDTADDLYTNAVLLPFLQMANDKLSDKLLVHGIPVQMEVATTATITALDTTYTLPADFMNPVRLWQKPVGQDVDFSPMFRKAWEPGETYTSEFLGVWDYRNQQIIFQPATVDVDVRLDYNKILTALTVAGDTLQVFGSLSYLSSKTASLAAQHIGMNPIKAGELEVEAREALADIEIIAVKNMQHVGTRRRPFRIRRRSGDLYISNT